MNLALDQYVDAVACSEGQGKTDFLFAAIPFPPRLAELMEGRNCDFSRKKALQVHLAARLYMDLQIWCDLPDLKADIEAGAFFVRRKKKIHILYLLNNGNLLTVSYIMPFCTAGYALLPCAINKKAFLPQVKETLDQHKIAYSVLCGNEIAAVIETLLKKVEDLVSNWSKWMKD